VGPGARRRSRRGRWPRCRSRIARRPTLRRCAGPRRQEPRQAPLHPASKFQAAVGVHNPSSTRSVPSSRQQPRVAALMLACVGVSSTDTMAALGIRDRPGVSPVRPRHRRRVRRRLSCSPPRNRPVALADRHRRRGRSGPGCRCLAHDRSRAGVADHRRTQRSNDCDGGGPATETTQRRCARVEDAAADTVG
jgi:hypothetical protein